MTWHLPTSVDEVLRLRADNPEAPIVAGGTFLGILVRQGLVEADEWISLQNVRELKGLGDAGDLSVGAMVTHRRLELDPKVLGVWPGVGAAFRAVASPRVRNVATMGGVLADADYASDPPSMLLALSARVVARSVRGEREIPVEELIVGHYETSLAADELIVEVRVPGGEHRAAYRKFRTRSHEDRPCVGVAACRRGPELRVAVGAVADRPQYFPELCDAAAAPADIAQAYAAAIDPLSDFAGSSDYRRRVIAVEVRRALEELAA